MDVVSRVQQLRSHIKELMDLLYLAEQELLILEARNKFLEDRNKLLEAENQLLKRDFQSIQIDQASFCPREAPTRLNGLSID